MSIALAGKVAGGGAGGAAGDGAGGEPPNADLKIDPKQMGKKLGKHAQDFGRDPSTAGDRAWLTEHIQDIAANPDQVRVGSWNPTTGGGTDYIFYERGGDVVVTKRDGSFVTILKGGASNQWFLQAMPK